MKKKLAAVTLFLSSALVATGCDSNEVTYKENDNGQSIIFSINGSEYTADDLLKDLQDSSTAKTKLYGEVSRQVFTKYAEDNLSDKLDSIREDAENDVEDFKDDCQTNAKEEGTDYDTYLENALAQKGVETLEELKALYYYQGLKNEILDDFVEEENNYNYFLNEYLATYTPFQVKHVLVAANTADTNYRDGTMTADNARKLLSVLDRFVAGDSFDKVAELTDDTSSKDNGGVMPFNEAQNYVSEFRFATYAQEIFGKYQSLDDRYAMAAKLHVVNDDEESSDFVSKEEFEESNLYSVYADGIKSVQLNDILTLNNKVTNDMKGNYNYFDKDGNEKGNEIPTIAEQPYEMNVSKFNDEGEINEKYFEEYQLKRNEIFNRYLNTHQVKYIELENSVATEANSTTLDDGRVVLADDNDNPIFFALASTGIHFMSMVWNSNDPLSVNKKGDALESLAKLSLEKNDVKVADGKTALETAQAEFKDAFNRKINEAYFTLYDDEEDDVDYSKYQYTYIGRNGAYNTESKLIKNSDSLLSAISGYASSLEYYLFDAIVYQETSELVSDAKYSVSFYDEELNELIKEFVQDKLTSTDETFAASVQAAAETYGSKLAREAEVKAALDSWYK
ncbi:MAG: hypothetical protein IJD46_02235 [Bacilli bacterium]|nr:hypothetical protein [Bacilli bacterium]